MKFLADAHIGRGIVNYVTSLGHDILHAEVLEPRLPDSEILRLASEQERIVLTADKDFGELVFRRLFPCHGVILLRLSAPSERERLSLFIQYWPVVEQHAVGHFIVLTDKQVRRTALP
jgi:predicted nuclease of predicted toxin-antitoxin system